MKLAVSIAGVACAVSAFAFVPTPADMRGPFPILSAAYHEDGSLDCEALAREIHFVDEWKCPGAIWGQSNDEVDLLTRAEKETSFEAAAKAVEGRPITLAIGVDGTNTAEMVELARVVEAIADRHPTSKIAMIVRPPDNVKTTNELEAAWTALGRVSRRPVIFQTYGTKTTPTPPVDLMVRLAKAFPHAFGYIKEEAAGNEANERMLKENAAKPAIKTVFAGWGGWQWLYQLRQCGCEGLVTERCAYAPILGYIWRRHLDGDSKGDLAAAYAMYRLLIDQRNFPGGLRGYSLYYLQKVGAFKNLVSREYAKKGKVTEGGTFGSGSAWKLGRVKLSPRQRAELDLLYADMLRFVKQGNAR